MAIVGPVSFHDRLEKNAGPLGHDRQFSSSKLLWQEKQRDEWTYQIKRCLAVTKIYFPCEASNQKRIFCRGGYLPAFRLPPTYQLSAIVDSRGMKRGTSVDPSVTHSNVQVHKKCTARIPPSLRVGLTAALS